MHVWSENIFLALLSTQDIATIRRNLHFIFGWTTDLQIVSQEM